MARQKSVWLVRGGTRDEAKGLFLDERMIGLGPPEVGDLTNVESSREGFKRRYRDSFPEATPTGVGGVSGQLFRFVHEATKGDIVVYPSKDGRIHVGRIKGDYEYNPVLNGQFPHQRRVTWVRSVQRAECSEKFLKEARAFKTFYSITKCAAEAHALAGGNVVTSVKDE